MFRNLIHTILSLLCDVHTYWYVVDNMDQLSPNLQCIQGIDNQGKTVVMTGAMQGSDSAFADGPGNIMSASVVAASRKASGQGVLIAFSQQVCK